MSCITTLVTDKFLIVLGLGLGVLLFGFGVAFECLVSDIAAVTAFSAVLWSALLLFVTMARLGFVCSRLIMSSKPG